MSAERVSFGSNLVDFLSCLPVVGIIPWVASLCRIEKSAMHILNKRNSEIIGKDLDGNDRPLSDFNRYEKNLILVDYGNVLCRGTIQALVTIVAIAALAVFGLILTKWAIVCSSILGGASLAILVLSTCSIYRTNRFIAAELATN